MVDVRTIQGQGGRRVGWLYTSVVIHLACHDFRQVVLRLSLNPDWFPWCGCQTTAVIPALAIARCDQGTNPVAGTGVHEKARRDIHCR